MWLDIEVLDALNKEHVPEELVAEAQQEEFIIAELDEGSMDVPDNSAIIDSAPAPSGLLCFPSVRLPPSMQQPFLLAQ